MSVYIAMQKNRQLRVLQTRAHAVTVWCVRIFLQTTTRSYTGQRRTASARNKAFTLSNNLINRAVNVLAIDTLKRYYNLQTGVYVRTGVCASMDGLTYGRTYACRQ